MSVNTPYFLEINHLSKEVKSGASQIRILNDVSLGISKGESVAITGASGSGKTTLLTLMAGLDLPTSGDIYIDQQQINTLNEEQRALIRARYVGFIFQSFQLLPNLTSLENVMLPLEIQYADYTEAKNKATYWLEKVGLGERIHHYPLTLSGGEQQRVAVARAFITQPAILFADEMTGNLDSKTGELISDIVFSLNAELKTTLVLITHDNHLATRCQRRFLLQDGMLQSC